MNTFKAILFGLMLSAITASAQFGNSYGNRNNSNRLPENTIKPSAPTPSEIEKDREEKVDKVMAKLKEDLNLDGLQEVAIRNEITANSKSMGIVMKSEDTDENKRAELQSLSEKLDKAILSYLNPEQKAKYLQFKEDRKSGNSPKESKKRKKKDEVTEPPKEE